jgi:hypothetical protein
MGQLSLPFPIFDTPTANERCPTCRGSGDTYYLASRPDVVGGTGTVKVPVSGVVRGDRTPRRPLRYRTSTV